MAQGPGVAVRYCFVIDPMSETLPLIPADEAGPVIGCVPGCEEFEDRIATLAPDVVLLDLRRLGARSGEFVRRARSGVPCARILVLGPADDPGAAEAAIRAGALGYITRPQNLVRALRCVRRGNVFITQAANMAVAQRVSP